MKKHPRRSALGYCRDSRACIAFQSSSISDWRSLVPFDTSFQSLTTTGPFIHFSFLLKLRRRQTASLFIVVLLARLCVDLVCLTHLVAVSPVPPTLPFLLRKFQDHS